MCRADPRTRIHGYIHSAPFVGFVSDFYSFIFFVGFYLFILYILIQPENWFSCISLNWLLVSFISCCIQNCVIFKKEK